MTTLNRDADILIAEIGSTTTVLTAVAGVNTVRPHILCQSQALTTVSQGDVVIGLQNALDEMEKQLGGPLKYGKMLASSSAAGGLRMTVHGLVPDMTAKAGKEAALGAGANIKLITSGKISETRLKEILAVSPNIALLAGGVDGGESETVTHNARMLAGAAGPFPIIYAGNADCQGEVAGIMDGSPHKLYIVDNVYPRVDELNVEASQRVIQSVFEEHITRAAGMERVREMVGGGIIPTPGAVMLSAKLLYETMGDLLVLDVGGATTDVHSVTEGPSENAGLVLYPEPLAKRTVEGDLGVFINAANVVLDEDIEALGEYDGMPRTPGQEGLVFRMALNAARTAVARHAGRKRFVYGPSGRRAFIHGKDLTGVRRVIGTGGVLSKHPLGLEALRKAFDIKNPAGELLLPNPAGLIFHRDGGYIMAAMGSLSRYDADTAARLLKESIERDNLAS